MLKENSKTLLIGNFDGVHIGHQSLINFAQQIANDSGTQLTVVTFNPHPREVILNKKIDLILPYSEKISLLSELSIKSVDEIKFSKEISKMSPEDFIEQFLEKNNPINIVVGKDFRFGTKASGDVDTLKRYKNSKFNVYPIDIEEIGDKIAQSIILFFESQTNREIIGRLKEYGLSFEMIVAEDASDLLIDKTFVISGVFEKVSRKELKELIEKNGGKNTGSISAKTNYLVAGEKMGPAKLAKATDLGVKIISEDEFLAMIS